MTTGLQFYTSLPINKTKLQLKIISNQLRIYFVVAYPNSDKNLKYIKIHAYRLHIICFVYNINN